MSPCAARQDTLLLWTPAYSTGRLGRWSLSSQSYESSSFQSWSEVTSTKDEQIRHCSPGGYLEVQGQGEAIFVLEASQKGWPGPSAISSRSMSGPRQCPRGSSSTGIPGQRGSHTASLQGEDRDKRMVRNVWGRTSHRSKLSPLEKATQETTWASVYALRHMPPRKSVLTGTPASWSLCPQWEWVSIKWGGAL